MRDRVPHAGAWWTWALGLAVAAMLTTNPLVVALVVASACLVVATCHDGSTRAASMRLYLWAAAIIVVVRVVMRVAFGHEGGVAVAALDGLAGGLQLGAIIVCVGAANALGDPKRLLASLPPALHEVGVATTIALSTFPQLAESVVRVRRARMLRATPGARPGRLVAAREVFVPVLADALDRSIQLAASMDSRGYGSTRGMTSPRARRLASGMLIAGVAGIAIGMYATLDVTAPRVFAVPMLASGVLLALLGLRSAGGRVARTRYRPDPVGPRELLIAGSGLACAASLAITRRIDPIAATPPLTLDALPPLPLLVVVGALLSTLPALARSTTGGRR